MNQLADKSARLYNYVVDIFAVSILIFFGFFFLLMGWGVEENLFYYIICFAGYYGYYFVMEWKTGKTLGKLLSETKVCAMDGNPAPISKLIIRTLARIPLFDELYLLLGPGITLHDKLSGTRVVKIK